MSSINQRIQAVINEMFNGNVSEFERSSGIKPYTVKNIVGSRQTKPSYDVLESIIRNNVQISSDWLLTGEGDMLKTDQITPAINYDYKGAPYYNVDFNGGFDLIYNDQTQRPDYYIDYQPYNKPGVLWCNVTGHSMEPEINHGDTIAIRELLTWRVYIPFGEIYGIVTTEHRTVKRIGKADREGYIRLIPTNKSPEYSPQDIPLSIVQRIFSVVGSVKRFQ